MDDRENPRTEAEMEELKQEVAEELDLDDDIKNRGWGNMTTRETGKIGGNMVRKLVEKGKQELVEEDERK